MSLPSCPSLLPRPEIALAPRPVDDGEIEGRDAHAARELYRLAPVACGAGRAAGLPPGIISSAMESPTATTFTFRPIGTVHSPYEATREVPKGLGAEHRAEGTIEIFPEYEA